MIGESINFMIIGMAVVFIFLIVMVLVLEIQGRILSKFIGDEVVKKDDDKITDASSGTIDVKTTAVISAAVKQHLKQNK
jgi:oxaloacetate decarboxylase gamma subunit